jgi:hypothetical protein
MVKTAFVKVSKSFRNDNDPQFDINFRFEAIPDRNGIVFTFPYAFENQYWFHTYFMSIPDSEPENLFSLYLNESEDQLTFSSDFNYKTVQNGVTIGTRSGNGYKIRFGFVST